MKYIRKNDNKRKCGYCYSGWFNNGCIHVCSNNCMVVCRVNIKDKETSSEDETVH